MAKKPNYRFERAERERLQAERRAKREQKKAAARQDAGTPDATVEIEPTSGAAES